MSRNRQISPDFWTWEAVIDCAPMTRLLFLGLQNFADDFGVQPLRPRTLRLQVFPGDDLDDAGVRVLIEELETRGLVRRYEVEGVEYLAIVDWHLLHRVGKRAQRRHPRDPALPPEPAVEPAPATATAPPIAEETPTVPPEVARWRRSVGRSLRHFMPNCGPPDVSAMDRSLGRRGLRPALRRLAGDQRRRPPIMGPPASPRWRL